METLRRAVFQTAFLLYWLRVHGKIITMVLVFKKIQWTAHAELKIKQYGLSKTKVLAVVRKPERVEEGIAEGTTAAMQSNKKYGSALAKRPPGEIWLMYRDVEGVRRIISAWRYPGISKPGESIPIPEEIRQELMSN